LLTFGIIGAYAGLVIEQTYLPTRDYHLFFYTSLPKTILRIIVTALIGLPAIATLFLVSKNNPFWVVLIFRSMAPAFLGNLYVFGFSKLIAWKLNLINTETGHHRNPSAEGKGISNSEGKKKQ